MKLFSLIGLLLVAVPLVVIAAGQLGLLRGHPPSDLGVHEGKFKAPSKTPNSVSSQADLYPDHPQRAYAKVEPFKFSGSGRDAMHKLSRLLRTLPNTVVVKDEPGYLYAQASTPLLKYTDDVEFTLDENRGVIDVRSASRLGLRDFGTNRQRIESLRARFTQ